MKEIVLASSSSLRKKALIALGISFTIKIPNIDETPLNNESPLKLAERLSVQKAKKAAEVFDEKNASNKVWIGSDQVIVCQDTILGKPNSLEAAQLMLLQNRGQILYAYTGICVWHPKSQTQHQHVEISKALLRDLTKEEIHRYLEKESPLECAAALKVETSGIALFEWIETKDPSAILGIPLITLSKFLRKLKIQIP